MLGPFRTEVPKAIINRMEKADSSKENACFLDIKDTPSVQQGKGILKAFYSKELFSGLATINEDTEQEVELENVFTSSQVSPLEKAPEKKRKQRSPIEQVEDASRMFNKQIAQKRKQQQETPPRKKKPKQEEKEKEETSYVIPPFLEDFACEILNGNIPVDTCGIQVAKDDTVETLMKRHPEQFATAWTFSNYLKARF